jgi:hypothetical protein
MAVPNLSLLRRQSLRCSPIAWATARMAALFIKHFLHDRFGVRFTEPLPIDIRLAIIRESRARISHREACDIAGAA